MWWITLSIHSGQLQSHVSSLIKSRSYKRFELVRHGWKCDTEGMDGLGRWVHWARGIALIHSIALEGDGHVWEHISISRQDGELPSWEQTRDVFREVAGPGTYGIIVIPPSVKHVDIAEVMHVWHCFDHVPVPDFTRGTKSI